MPGYTATLGYRFSARDLLKETKGNADVAFLRAGWYYASLVPVNMYPCGLRDWKGHAGGAASSAASAGGAAASPWHDDLSLECLLPPHLLLPPRRP